MNYDERASQQSILKFLDYYDIKNDQGQLLDFRNHAYLWDIYKDFTPVQAIRKAAQIGFSTTANIKALWLAKNKGMDIIYSLPSASDIKDFVSGKTNRLIDNNNIFQQWTADKDSIEQKRVGSNVIYFKGTWTERAAIATPADLYISDETDRSKQEIVQQFETRLQHSSYAWRWYFSNPSAPGHGVDKYWGDSDQKYWFVPCGCGNWTQGLSMDNIRDDKFVCLKCGKELDRRHPKCQWVKRWEGREISGYWISSLMAPWISAKQILAWKDEKPDEQFSNFVLGEPFMSKGNILSRQAFFQNLTSQVNKQKSTPVIGVDTGIGINLVMGNAEGIFYYHKSDDYTHLRDILRRYPDAIAVIDQGGDIIGPRKLREEFKNRVYLCFFGQDRKNDEIIRWNDEDGSVIADRSKSIQMVVDEFTEKRIPIYGTEREWGEYWREWQGMYRTSEEKEDAPGTVKYVWHKPSTGRCDYPFATVYWRIGMDKALGEFIKFVDPEIPQFASRGIDPQEPALRFMPKYRFPSS